MNREPSIHITKGNFVKLLKKNGIGIPDKIIDDIFQDARNIALSHRSILKSNSKKAEEQFDKRIKSPLHKANLLSQIIYSTRIKKKHIGVTKITQKDIQWANLVNLVPLADEFCTENNFDTRKGYIKLVDIGMDLLKTTKNPNFNYFASWLFKHMDWVINTYNTQEALENDDNPSGTEELYDIYQTYTIEISGLSLNFKKDVNKYINFIKARKLADLLGINYENFIAAQFDALSFCNGIPQIDALWGDKAEERVQRYLAKYPNARESKSSIKVDWSKFK